MPCVGFRRVTVSKRGNVGFAIILGVVLLASSGYDFWRGYHEDHSIEGGIVFTVLGILALLSFSTVWQMTPLPFHGPA